MKGYSQCSFVSLLDLIAAPSLAAMPVMSTARSQAGVIGDLPRISWYARAAPPASGNLLQTGRALRVALFMRAHF